MDAESTETGEIIPEPTVALVEALQSSTGPSRSRRVVLSGAALLLAVGGTAGVGARSSRSPSAEKSLAAVQAFLKTAHSTHVDGTTETVQGAPGDVGESSTSRSRLDGDLVMPDSGH